MVEPVDGGEPVPHIAQAQGHCVAQTSTFGGAVVAAVGEGADVMFGGKEVVDATDDSASDLMPRLWSSPPASSLGREHRSLYQAANSWESSAARRYAGACGQGREAPVGR